MARTGSSQSIANSRKQQRLFDSKDPYKMKIERRGLSRDLYALYITDLFHTLLHMPKWRFLLVFAVIFISKYACFAMVYWMQPQECIVGIHKFTHALWFSVQTAATIGYGGQLTPNPDCTVTNGIIMLQTIVNSLIDYAMLGIVYARFASPSRRAYAIRFSRHMTMHNKDGQWRLSLRVANVRKHQIMKPEVRMLLAMTTLSDDDAAADASSRSRRDFDALRSRRAANVGGTSISRRGAASSRHARRDDVAPYSFQELEVEFLGANKGCLWLGLPAVVTHIIDADSPLYDMSLDAMESRGMEVLVLMDGIDAMTSNYIQARYAYHASDVRLNEQFGDVLLTRDGPLGIDYSGFDLPLASQDAQERGEAAWERDELTASQQSEMADNASVPLRPSTLREAMPNLKRLSFRVLTEQPAFNPRASALERTRSSAADATGWEMSERGATSLSRASTTALHPTPRPAPSSLFPHLTSDESNEEVQKYRAMLRELCNMVVSDTHCSSRVRTAAAALQSANSLQ